MRRRENKTISEQVKVIEIIFENMDYVRIPVAYVAAFELEQVTASFHRVAVNAIVKHSVAQAMYMQVQKDFRCGPDSPMEIADIYEALPKRLAENDITYLRIHYFDDTYEDIYVPWQDCECDAYTNRLQRTEFDQEGNLVIRIKKGEGE